MSTYILSIDQGTTSSRAILFNPDLTIKSVAQQEFTQHFPQSGWVEHDVEEIWQSVLATCTAALDKAAANPEDIAAIGITNQRETTVVWERETGKPIHNAIVWQDRRTADYCDGLKKAGHEPMTAAKTGLVLDPYFSGTKLRYILETVPGARQAARAGKLCFGTVDSYLIWKLTNGVSHVTDATNAARTLLYNIHENRWDSDLLALLEVPEPMLPRVCDSADDFGTCAPEYFGGEISILGVAGDQQAATIGQACFAPGMIKSTYGTGCFAVLNTGTTPVTSKNKLLTTIAYRLKGETTYALEGSIFVAGAAVQWLRDGLQIIESAEQTHPLADRADPNQSVYLVPAFTGLGAPHWDAHARGALYGLTRGTGPAELARAALESVGYQTKDLIEAMRGDWPGLAGAASILRVDGGMTASDWAMGFLADILDMPVDRPTVLETTAVGAAYLAGLQAGVCPDPASFAESWALDRRFEPQLDVETRAVKYAGWQDAVKRTLTRVS
ncbi:MAG: glycerol kinase GlpK [Magnetospiraceae bacterium]